MPTPRKANGTPTRSGRRSGQTSGTPKHTNTKPAAADTDGAVKIYDYNNSTESESSSPDTESDDGGGGEESQSPSTESPSPPKRVLRSKSCNMNYKDDTNYNARLADEESESTDESEDDNDLDEEMPTEIDEEIQPLIESLSIADYYDMSENQHFISREDIDHLYKVNVGIEFNDENENQNFTVEKVSTSELSAWMKKSRGTDNPAPTRPKRHRTTPKKYVEARLTLSNGHSVTEQPSIVTLPGSSETTMTKTSYEDRLTAKNRVTYKIKAYQHPKSVGRKITKLDKKVILSKKAQLENVEPVRSISVRKELKRIFAERGFPDWKSDPNQEKLTTASLERIKKEFPEWMLLLSHGLNIMMYGYGSKICVFEELENYLTDEFTIVEIDGTIPKVDPTEALSQFVKCLSIRHSVKGGNFYAKVRNLLPKLRPLALHPPIFLFVRNLEQICAKNEPLFYLITRLATLPFVHMIASCDHFNSPLVFDHGLVADMGLVWKRCTTYAPYKVEAKMVTGAFMAEAFEESSSRVTLGHVYGAVTLKSKRAFNILASLQLQAVKSKQYDINTWSGIEFSELARHCREKFIANNDSQLNTLILEFIDNKIIVKSRSDAAGASSTGRRGAKKKNIENCLRIAIDENKLEEFIIANPVQND